MSAIASIYHLHHGGLNMEYGMNMMRDFEKYPADHIHTWHNPQVFLGCHAQWITPESIREILPFYDSERRLAITADAIIDNRSELFDKLQVVTEDRKTMPDSLLILLAYEKWGQDSPRYLVGEFAYLIWDERKQLLFGARDFSGSRTLYYSHTNELFAFSSTMQPLLTIPGVHNKFNDQWFAEFLAIPIIADSVDLFASVYQSIEQIPPSHSFIVSDGAITFTRYCTLETTPKIKLRSDEEYEEAFRDVFQTAVNARLRTHRPVGSHLSGGLDSGAVVSFAAEALRTEKKQLHTFSYVPVEGFVDWTPKRRIADERPSIHSTVKYVGNIQDNYSDFVGMDPLSEINEWLDIMEMPYKFFINTFWLRGIYEQAHKEGIGILLSGQRGNSTVSWGPALDYQATLIRKLKLFRFYHELKHYSTNIGVRKSILFRIVSKKAFPFIEQIRSRKREQEPTLINPQFASRTNVYDRLHEHGFGIWGSTSQSAYEARKQHFNKLYFWNLTGTCGSKLSLRYSLWERDPTNDLRVVQFCLSVPEEQFVQNGLDRALIRRATKDRLPDDVRLNQRTRGIQGADGISRFAPSWSIFVEELQQLVEDPRVSEYLNITGLKISLAKIQNAPQPDYLFDDDFRMLIRGLIFYRFIKKHEGR